jgi:site-specific DNA-methyltransferase (adenine-specific)
MVGIYKYPNGVLYHGDCLQVMESLVGAGLKVDLILADLPYGTTQNKWDSVLPLSELWKLYSGKTDTKPFTNKGLARERTPIVLTAQTPFDKILGVSNIEFLKYEWIWYKNYFTGHLNAKKMPLKDHENVLVFYKKLPTYNPQFTEGEPYYTEATGENTSSNYGKQSEYVIDNPGIRYPRTVQKFDKAKGKHHPTQKPLPLFEYLIKTYTNEGDLVIDNVLGSGTTAIACERLNRKWIGIEKEEKYIEVIRNRLGELANE